MIISRLLLIYLFTTFYCTVIQFVVILCPESCIELLVSLKGLFFHVSLFRDWQEMQKRSLQKADTLSTYILVTVAYIIMKHDLLVIILYVVRKCRIGCCC